MIDMIAALLADADVRSVLIVDDDAKLGHSLERLLKRFFAHVTVVSDGQAAMDAYRLAHDRHHDFDVVITDLELPQVGGLALIRGIKKIAPDQKIVILSAHDEPEFMAEAISLGVGGYLLKPLDMPQLLTVLERLFGPSVQNVPAGERRRACHHVTRLPLAARLEDDVASATGNMTLIRIHIDNIASIRDQLGAGYADIYLKELSQFFLKLFPDETRYALYHTDDDELALLVRGVSEDGRQIGHHILSLSKYFYTSDAGIVLTSPLTLGIAVGRNNLVLGSELALRQAQSAAPGSLHMILTESMSETVTPYSNNQNMLKLLFQAVEEDKIVPFFQPIADVRRGLAIVHYECLIRILTDGQLYTPSNFLDLALNIHQISMLTRMMIRKSFEYFSLRDPSLAFVINIGGEDLQDETFLAFVNYWRDKYELDAGRVIFEVHDHHALYGSSDILRGAASLKGAGYKISIDDFGRAEFDFLRIFDLKPDFIKIDGTLIQRYADDAAFGPRLEKIVRLIALCEAKCIAKFVFDARLIGPLHAMGVDYIQGYAVGEPRGEIL